MTPFKFKQSNQNPKDLILDLVAHGISAIPVYVSFAEKEGTTKKEKHVVTGKWKVYQTSLISEDEVNRRFARGLRDKTFKEDEPNVTPNGVALALSSELGNLANLDFDFDGPRKFQLFWNALTSQFPTIRQKIYIERTPSGGYHVIFRLPASIPTPAKGEVYAARMTATGEKQVCIETRGYAQILIISPTTGYLHEVSNLPLVDLETLTEEEYRFIIEFVRSLDELPPEATSSTPPGRRRISAAKGVTPEMVKYKLDELILNEDVPEQLGPIGMFNRFFPVGEYLMDKGWQVKGPETENGIPFIRPGKDQNDERCATLKNQDGINYFYNFSTSVNEIEANKAYTPFALFCAYEGYSEQEGLNVIAKLGYTGYQQGTKAVLAAGLNLEKDKYGQYAKSILNAVEVLQKDPQFVDVAFYNELTDALELSRPLDYLPEKKPFDKQVRDVIRVIASKKYSISFSDQTMQTAVNFVYPRKRHNPFISFVESSEWDGIDRISTLLCDCFGVEFTPYVAAITQRWLVAAIARQYFPGTKFDYTLTLISVEGTGKSGLVARLFDPCYLGINGWNADAMSLRHLCDPKLFTEGVRGKVGVEIAEFAGSKRVEVEELKSALTARQRTFRGAYKEQSDSVGIRQVFCVTTNEQQFLTALTGNRRFWVVYLPGGALNGHVYKYLTEAVCRQIWAQALAIYKSWCTPDGKFRPEKLLLPPELEKVATAMQEKARHRDPLEDDILQVISELKDYEVVDKTADYVALKPIYRLEDTVSTKMLWEAVNPACDTPPRISTADSRKIGSIMAHYNWTATNNIRVGSVRQRGYVRPESDYALVRIPRSEFTPRPNDGRAWNPLVDYDCLRIGCRVDGRNLPVGYTCPPAYQD